MESAGRRWPGSNNLQINDKENEICPKDKLSGKELSGEDRWPSDCFDDNLTMHALAVNFTNLFGKALGLKLLLLLLLKRGNISKIWAARLELISSPLAISLLSCSMLLVKQLFKQVVMSCF